MKNLIIIISLLFIFSCNKSSESVADQNNNAVENADSDISSSFKSYRGTNMVDAIYTEIKKNDPEVQNMDENIARIYKNGNDIINEKEKILSKSDNYYIDAQTNLRAVTDSVLKKEMESLLKLSSDKYALKTKNLTDLISKINQNNKVIADQYSVFKIRKTLPEIEKYQNQNSLKSEDLNKIISEQNQLIEQLKKIK